MDRPKHDQQRTTRETRTGHPGRRKSPSGTPGVRGAAAGPARAPAASRAGATIRALVLSDASQLRQQEKYRYDMCAKALDQSLRRSQAFTAKDTPAFQLWMETEFADEISTARLLQTRTDRLEETIMQVQLYARLKRCALSKAYQIVSQAEASGTTEELWDELRAQHEAEAAADQDDDDDDRFAAEAARAENERRRRQEDEAEAEHHGNRHSRRAQGAATRSAADASPEGGYLKTLYRRLVKLLHPDRRGELSPIERQRWQETQEAYAWKDAQALERLLRAVDGETASPLDFKTMPIGDIIALREDVERRLRALANETAAQQRDPAWNFTSVRQNRGKLAGLKRRMAKELEHDFYLLQIQHQEMLLIIDQLGRTPNRRGRGKSGRR